MGSRPVRVRAIEGPVEELPAEKGLRRNRLGDLQTSQVESRLAARQLERRPLGPLEGRDDVRLSNLALQSFFCSSALYIQYRCKALIEASGESTERSSRCGFGKPGSVIADGRRFTQGVPPGASGLQRAGNSSSRYDSVVGTRWPGADGQRWKAPQALLRSLLGIFSASMQSFQIRSTLNADPAKAWQHATSPRGVNAEFWPFLRMTFPASVTDFSRDWEPGRRLFRSWILLFGVIPIEYDDLSLSEVDEGRRFLERSEMLMVRSWQHERELLVTSSGVELVDRIVFESRVPALESIQGMIFRLIFRYRHFRLRRLYERNAD